ncbi:hypothetical protein ARTHRO9AX_130120 [Arthrobacter sp. 9AX]|nr:hypothetical protein ARTHRO9AX_130120 [Arthrobacter sp. 9AX]
MAFTAGPEIHHRTSGRRTSGVSVPAAGTTTVLTILPRQAVWLARFRCSTVPGAIPASVTLRYIAGVSHRSHPIASARLIRPPLQHIFFSALVRACPTKEHHL